MHFFNTIATTLFSSSRRSSYVATSRSNNRYFSANNRYFVFSALLLGITEEDTSYLGTFHLVLPVLLIRVRLEPSRPAVDKIEWPIANTLADTRYLVYSNYYARFERIRRSRSVKFHALLLLKVSAVAE